MNIQQAKTIKITDFLEKSGHKPTAIKGDTCFYIAPYRKEKTASFTVNSSKNYFYDYGTGEGGDIVLLTTLMHNCGISEALSILDTNPINSFSFHQQEKNEKEPNYKIISDTALEHPALTNYLQSRKILKQNKLLRQLTYVVNSKTYFGIAMQNNSDGWEIRNKFTKLALGKKDLTFINHNSNSVLLFEGFLDWLSYCELNPSWTTFDVIILNSVALVKKSLLFLKQYSKIDLFLDQDEAGNKGTDLILSMFKNATDQRFQYKDFKDFNEFLIAQTI